MTKLSALLQALFISHLLKSARVQDCALRRVGVMTMRDVAGFYQSEAFRREPTLGLCVPQ